MWDFDAIVIGAGNAGLTAAATLQRAGLRTLLVERHNVPGGTGTSFRRGVVGSRAPSPASRRTARSSIPGRIHTEAWKPL
jgi:phytoene dehydrogenase-like protein